MLAIFEVGCLTSLAFWIGTLAAGIASSAIGTALGNDAVGIAITTAIWAPIVGFIAAYIVLKRLAR